MAKALLIKQIKGSSQVSRQQKEILKSIGLRGIGSSIYRTDTRAIRGMLNETQHLILAEQVEKVSTRRPKVKSQQPGYKLG